MSIAANSLDQFIQQQVSSGACASTHEAEQELIANLIERDLDSKIAKGRADIQAGKSRELNIANNAAFLAALEKHLLNH